MTRRAPSKTRKCFISNPHGVTPDHLRHTIAEHGYQVFDVSDVTAASSGWSWPDLLRRTIADTDLVIAILPDEHRRANVYYEVGLAHGLGKRVLILASPQQGQTPTIFDDSVVLRADLSNREAILFALDQINHAPPPKDKYTSAEYRDQSHPLGDEASHWLRRLEQLPRSRSEFVLLTFIRELLLAAGLDVMAESQSTSLDGGADFAVWSDRLEPFLGNPLLIEVKNRIHSRADAESAIRQVERYIAKAGAKSGLLLYFDGRDPSSEATPLNIVAISVRQLIEGLVTASFSELILSLQHARSCGEGR